MKLGLLATLALFLHSAQGAKSADYSSIFSRLDAIDQEFQSKGSSLKVLQDYDSMASELVKLESSDDPDYLLRSKISNVYLKKGILNYSLGRDKLSLADFDMCLKYGDTVTKESFKTACFDKFVEISFQLGRIEDIEKKIEDYQDFLPNSKIEDLKSKIAYVNNKIQFINESMGKGLYEQVIKESSEVISQFDSIPSLRSARIQATINMDTIPFDEKVDLLIQDYMALINNNDKTLDLQLFVDLFKLQYFIKEPGSPLSTPAKLLHKCLRIDNDFKPCQLYSKLSSKLDPIYKLYNKISMYYSFVYIEAEGDDENEKKSQGDFERVEELEPTEQDWKDLNDLLLNPKSKIKLRRDQLDMLNIENGYSKYANNLELIINIILENIHSFKFSNKDQQLLTQVNFINELIIMADESFTHLRDPTSTAKTSSSSIDYKSFTKLNQIREHNRLTKEKPYLYREINKADKLISRKSFESAYNLIASFDKESWKHTRLYKTRFEIVDREYGSKLREQEQRKQQERQQHQRHQEQQFYQQFHGGGGQQHRQQQPPRQKQQPTNDYYKVLGVSKDADESEIKKAYREKVKQNHPDKLKNTETKLSDEEIEAKMAEINNAYEVLSDPEAKKNYDQFGEDPNDGHNGNSNRQYQQPPPHRQQHHQFFQGGAGGGQKFHFKQNGNPFAQFGFAF